MKTLKVESACPADYQTFEELAAILPRFLEHIHNTKQLHSAIGNHNPARFEEEHARQIVQSAASSVPTRKGALHLSVRI